MDIAALSSLLTSSTATLAALHAELGDAPEKLQDALALLAQTVRSTVDAQIASARAQVETVARDCEELKARADGIRTALGDEPSASQDAGKRNSGTRDSKETLLGRQSRLRIEVTQLEDAYRLRNEQIDTILEHIKLLAPVLEGGDAADLTTDSSCQAPDSAEPAVPALPERVSVAVPSSDSAAAATSIPAATSAYVQALTAHLNGLHALQQSRNERFRAYLQHIFDLWGSLHLRPDIERDAFERAICRAAGVKPVITKEVVEVEDEATGSIRLDERVGFRGQFEEMADGEELGGEGDEATVLLPSVATLRKLRDLIGGLETERKRREERIQYLYDELFVLWSRFDCDESEMDEFVLENKGLSLESIRAYESELDKMLTLKAQHSLTFIARIREQMIQYSQSARITQAECEALFPEFFIPLPDANLVSDQPQPAYDALLAAHEQAIPRIVALLEAKAPIMRLIDRYEELCREEEELAESAKNTSRLFAGAKKAPGSTGAGAKVEKPKRDPGRLLREEKMRKRVKVLKPKIEAEMLKAIPAWEQEHGEAFMLDGERYLDQLEDIIAARKPVSSIPPVSSVANLAGQKRARQGSVGPSPAPTPSTSRVTSLVLATPLGPSSAHNRAVSASAISSAVRGKALPPQTPSHAPAAKKARLANSTSAGAPAGPGTARPAPRTAGPTPANARIGPANLGSSISSTLARTPAALQATRTAKAVPQPTAMLNIAKRPVAQTATQQAQPVITLLPPSSPFRPRPSMGLPFVQGPSSNAQAPRERVTSSSSNSSMATSNGGTVIVHPAPQPSASVMASTAYQEQNVTAPLCFGANRQNMEGSTAPLKPKAGRSRPSLSLQQSLLGPPGEATSSATGGPRMSSTLKNFVLADVSRRLGAAGNFNSEANWDRLVEEEDDMVEEDLIMATVNEEEGGAGEVGNHEAPIGAGSSTPVADAAASDDAGVRRSARVAAATAH